MAGLIGEGVSLRGIYDESWTIGWNLSGGSAISRANVGHLMTQDITVKNTAKLAGDGDAPLGVLQSYENRAVEGVVVGTVAQKAPGLSIPFTGALAIGDSVVGSATPGTAKKAGAANRTLVVEINVTAGTAVVQFL
jgi:hypothetical protein